MAKHGPERTLQPSCPRPHATVCTLPDVLYQERDASQGVHPICPAPVCSRSRIQAKAYTPAIIRVCLLFLGRGVHPSHPSLYIICTLGPYWGRAIHPSHHDQSLPAYMHVCTTATMLHGSANAVLRGAVKLSRAMWNQSMEAWAGRACPVRTG